LCESEKEKVEKIMSEKIRECLGLFNSMILGGENHSETSKRVFGDAKKQLSEMELEIKQNKIMFAYELGFLSEMQAVKLLNLSIVDFRYLYLRTVLDLKKYDNNSTTI
jgi:hypothetical protein